MNDYKLNTKYKDILAEILRKNRSAIMNSILTEWDENEYREFLKEESWKEGHEFRQT